MRTFMEATRTGLATAMYWNTTGSLGSTGELLLGQWRSAYTTRTAAVAGEIIRGNAPNGYIALWDGANLSHVGSENTFCFAGYRMEECNAEPSNAPYTARWVLSEGSFTVSFNNNSPAQLRSATPVEYGVTYNGLPYVFLQETAIGGTPNTDTIYTGVDQLSTTAVVSRISLMDLQIEGDVPHYFKWRSVGTVDY
jgi:hypothetical protein